MLFKDQAIMIMLIIAAKVRHVEHLNMTTKVVFR